LDTRRAREHAQKGEDEGNTLLNLHLPHNAICSSAHRFLRESAILWWELERENMSEQASAASLLCKPPSGYIKLESFDQKHRSKPFFLGKEVCAQHGA
jgi:hypothetical protein